MYTHTHYKQCSPQHMRDNTDRVRNTFFSRTVTTQTSGELTKNCTHINSLNSQNDSVR